MGETPSSAPTVDGAGRARAPAVAGRVDRVPFCTHAEALREFLSLEPPTRPTHVVVHVYAAQRKPVASGRGASGLAGRPPGGSSSL